MPQALLSEFVSTKGDTALAGTCSLIGFPAAMEHLLESAISSEYLLMDGSRIHRTATVHSSAVIEHAIIGPWAIVHEFASVRHSIIAASTSVGHCCEVARSYMANKSAVTHFCFLGDSIIGEGVLLGGGVRTANRRLDGEPVTLHYRDGSYPTGAVSFGCVIGDRTRIGGSAHLNPGTLVGRDCVIDPGVEVRGFVESASRVRRTFDYVTESRVAIESVDNQGTEAR